MSTRKLDTVGKGMEPSWSRMSARVPPLDSSVITHMCLDVSYHSKNLWALGWSKLCSSLTWVRVYSNERLLKRRRVRTCNR